MGEINRLETTILFNQISSILENKNPTPNSIDDVAVGLIRDIIKSRNEYIEEVAKGNECYPYTLPEDNLILAMYNEIVELSDEN
jgi:hypothetical protein